MFLLNSCLGQFSAASFRWHSFSRSYGVILPSSLTTLLPPALGFSPHPPVSDYGTGMIYTIAAFLDSQGPQLRYYKFAPHHGFPSYGGFAYRTGTPLAPVFPFPALLPFLCPHISDISWYRNLNLLSIDYVFRPCLRPRLTQGRSALPWKPWIFGLKDSHFNLATHSGILSSIRSTAPSGTASMRMECSSTNPLRDS